MALHHFPFDTDIIEIHLDSSKAYQVGIEALLPHAHKSATGISFFASSVLPVTPLCEWRIYDVNSTTVDADFGFPCSQLRLNLHLARNPWFYVQKPVLLLIILTLFSFLSFGLDPFEEYEGRTNYILTNILATSAFLFGVGANLPTLPYLTVFDKLIMHSFLTATAIGAETAICHAFPAAVVYDEHVGIALFILYLVVTSWHVLPGIASYMSKPMLNRHTLWDRCCRPDRFKDRRGEKFVPGLGEADVIPDDRPLHDAPSALAELSIAGRRSLAAIARSRHSGVSESLSLRMKSQRKEKTASPRGSSSQKKKSFICCGTQEAELF